MDADHPPLNAQAGVKSIVKRSSLILVLLSLFVGSSGITQTQDTRKESMTDHAIWTVRRKSNCARRHASRTSLNRMTLDKHYHGDLEGTGKGQMLAAGTEVKGSGAYVAIERLSGTLKGLPAVSCLQHSGTMTQGVPQLSITVVPDSGWAI